MDTGYVFVFNGSGDWKISPGGDWDLQFVELDGTEKVIGHHKIDGSICKVIKTADDKIVALTK